MYEGNVGQQVVTQSPGPRLYATKYLTAPARERYSTPHAKLSPLPSPTRSHRRRRSFERAALQHDGGPAVHSPHHGKLQLLHGCAGLGNCGDGHYGAACGAGRAGATELRTLDGRLAHRRRARLLGGDVDHAAQGASCRNPVVLGTGTQVRAEFLSPDCRRRHPDRGALSRRRGQRRFRGCGFCSTEPRWSAADRFPSASFRRWAAVSSSSACSR